MNTQQSFHLAVVAAGSGGHIIPALVLAQRWQEQHPGGRVTFFSGNKTIEKRILARLPKDVGRISLSLSPFPGKKVWWYPLFFFQLGYTFLKSLVCFLRDRPIKIITTGGLHAIPVCFAGKVCRIPIDIYELNEIPGKAVRFLAPIATHIYVVFPACKRFFAAKKSDLVPYPSRYTKEDMSGDKAAIMKKMQKESPSFSPKRKTLFILGGSQGSQFLNQLFKSWLMSNKLLHKDVQVIHQLGDDDLASWRQFYEDYAIPALPFSFRSDLKDFYILADFVVSRAGAGTLFELALFRKQSLIIPLETAVTHHQKDNAIAMVDRYPDLFTLQLQEPLRHALSLFANHMETFIKK